MMKFYCNMQFVSMLYIIISTAFSSLTSAFQVPFQIEKVSVGHHPQHYYNLKSSSKMNPFRRDSVNVDVSTSIFSSKDNNDKQPKKKKRVRKRKDPVQSESASSEPPMTNPVDDKKAVPKETKPIELRPREESPVQLKVQNVRDVVQGTSPSTSSSSPVASSTTITTTTATQTTSAGSQATSTQDSGSSSSSNDSFEQLLADAREMQDDEEKDGTISKENEASIPNTFGKILSTIVTVDFFVVLALLLWFLVGIFASSVLKDDTIQIAFNNNFETLTQPALGVLMIASVASNFFEDDKQEDQ